MKFIQACCIPDCLILYMESKPGGNILSVKALILKTVTMTSRHMQLQQVEHWRIVMMTFFLFSFLTHLSRTMNLVHPLLVWIILNH